MGHFKRAGVTPKRHLAEFKEFETELNLGDTVTAVSYTHLDVYKRQSLSQEKCVILQDNFNHIKHGRTK